MELLTSFICDRTREREAFAVCLAFNFRRFFKLFVGEEVAPIEQL